MQAVASFFSKNWPLMATGIIGVGSGMIAGNGFKKTWDSFTGLFTKSPVEDKE